MNIWIASHECSGICEAGGVKNVTFSLCKEFTKLGHNVTLFLPVFKCSDFSSVDKINKNSSAARIMLCGDEEIVNYSTGVSTKGGFKIVFVHHPAFEEKEAVYTYTGNEQLANPEHVRGKGHEDFLFLDTLFAKAVDFYSFCSIEADIPNIIHCQDASTATIPLYVSTNKFLARYDTKTVVTIHNAGPFYHHDFENSREAAWYTGIDESYFDDCKNGERIEPFLIAYKAGARLTTVSESYADELVNLLYETDTDGLSKCFFERKAEIVGITNGMDVDLYNPVDRNVSLLPFEYNPGNLELDGKLKCRDYFLKNLPNNDFSNSDFLEGITVYGHLNPVEDGKGVYICFHGRLATQKGLSVLAKAINPLLNNFPFLRFVITGQGESELENTFMELAGKFDGRLIFLNGYNKICARLSVAACDFIVLPSFFEPCGLEDFIAQIYGTIPVAHATGGLKKIVDKKTGFLFSPNTPESLTAKLSEVITIKTLSPSIIDEMIQKAYRYVGKEYLWENVVKSKYLPLFESLL